MYKMACHLSWSLTGSFWLSSTRHLRHWECQHYQSGRHLLFVICMCIFYSSGFPRTPPFFAGPDGLLCLCSAIWLLPGQDDQKVNQGRSAFIRVNCLNTVSTIYIYIRLVKISLTKYITSAFCVGVFS